MPSPVFGALLDETARHTLLRAANDTGKTMGMAHLTVRRCIDRPGLSCRFVGPTHHQVHTVAAGYVAELAGPYLHPSMDYTHGVGFGGGRTKVVRFANGSVIELLSLEDKVKAHEGAKKDLVVIDEPPTPGHFAANYSRVRDGGQLIIGATMVNAPIEWLRQTVEGGEPSPTHGRTVHGTGWVQYVARMTPEDCPFHRAEYIQQRIDAAINSPWDYEQRINGGWEGVTLDRIFVRFTEGNVSTTPPQGDHRVCLIMDHGEVSGHQWIGLGAYRGRRMVILDEISPDHPMTPGELAKVIREMLRRHGIPVTGIDLAVGDINTAGVGAAGWSVNDAITAAIAEQEGRSSPPFRILGAQKWPGSVQWGMRCVNYAAGNGDLQVHPRCKVLLAALRGWKGARTGADGKYSHPCDGLRYGIVEALGGLEEYARLRFA